MNVLSSNISCSIVHAGVQNLSTNYVNINNVFTKVQENRDVQTRHSSTENLKVSCVKLEKSKGKCARGKHVQFHPAES